MEAVVRVDSYGWLKGRMEFSGGSVQVKESFSGVLHGGNGATKDGRFLGLV